jgi:MbtH protein
VSNPFDDQGGTFVVLINDQGQHSLWPAAAEIPAGWSIAYEQNGRQACIEYIGKNWTDMRPGTGADIQRT